MKELQQDTNFGAAVQDAGEKPESALEIEQTVSFAPEEEIELPDGDTTGDADEELHVPESEDEDEHEEHHEPLSEQDYIDTEEADTEDGAWDQDDDEPVLVYDVPRPALTIDEAATILGKSVRAVERGISGKWGNRLPEGWKARRMKIDGQDEWRIIPPPSFRVRHSKVRTQRTEEMSRKTLEKPATAASEASHAPTPTKSLREEARDTVENLFGFSLNSFIESAGKRAKNEIARAAEYAMESSMEHPTIVIDRSDEVERLLRELANVQKELSDERRMHLEDLRLMAEMQSSMRLLEMKSSQTATLKDELIDATRTLQEHRRQYQEFLALPWWKRLFRKAP